MNAVPEVQDTPSGVVKIELAIGAATQCLADAETSLDQLRVKRGRALVVGEVDEELQKRRKAALAKGDNTEVDRLDREIDVVVDRLDADIEKAEKSVTRERDRLTVLNEDLAEAKTLEQQRRMDALFNLADAARKVGEALIRNEYAQLSAKLVSVLSKLTAINTFVRESNSALASRTAIAPVDSLNRHVAEPNFIRRVPDQIIPATTREVERCVGGLNSFPRKYVYETVTEDVAEKRITGYWLPELFDECVIPPVAEGSASWDKHGRAKAEAEKRYEEIIASLLGEV